MVHCLFVSLKSPSCTGLARDVMQLQKRTEPLFPMIPFDLGISHCRCKLFKDSCIHEDVDAGMGSP